MSTYFPVRLGEQAKQAITSMIEDGKPIGQHKFQAMINMNVGLSNMAGDLDFTFEEIHPFMTPAGKPFMVMVHEGDGVYKGLGETEKFTPKESTVISGSDIDHMRLCDINSAISDQDIEAAAAGAIAASLGISSILKAIKTTLKDETTKAFKSKFDDLVTTYNNVDTYRKMLIDTADKSRKMYNVFISVKKTDPYDVYDNALSDTVGCILTMLRSIAGVLKVTMDAKDLIGDRTAVFVGFHICMGAAEGILRTAYAISDNYEDKKKWKDIRYEAYALHKSIETQVDEFDFWRDYCSSK